MILITGGAFQGKLEFAEKELKIDKDKILNQLHIRLRDMMDKTAEEIAEEILSDRNTECVICDEVGCGIVPIDKSDREWRELCGRVMCILAKSAEAVYLVRMGIANRIM